MGAGLQWAIVDFLEGKGCKRWLVPISDIQKFDPASADDYFPKHKYSVKWQKSFCGEAGQYDDGCYEAYILLLGASLNEISEKAKEKSLRLPSNFNLVSAIETQVAAPMKKAQRNARRNKKTGEDSQLAVQARKRRMHRTQEIIDGREQPQKEEHKSSREKSVKKGHAEKDLKNVKKIDDHGSKISFSSESKRRLVEVRQELKNLKSPLHSGVIPSRTLFNVGSNRSRMMMSKTRLDADNVKVNLFSDEPKSPTIFDKPKEAQPSPASTVKASPLKPVELPVQWKEPSQTITTGESSEDDAAVLLDRLKKKHMFCQIKIEALESQLKKSKTKEEELNHKLDQTTKQLMELQDEFEKLKKWNWNLQSVAFSGNSSGSGITPKAKSFGLEKPGSFNVDLKFSCTDDIDNLKDADGTSLAQTGSCNSPLGTELEKLKAGSKKRSEKTVTSDESDDEDATSLAPSRSCNSPLGSELEKLKAGSKKRSAKTVTSDESDDLEDADATSLAPSRSKSRGETEVKKFKGGSKKRSEKTSTDSETDDETITERILADLKNEESLERSKGKVYIGKGVSINTNLWEGKLRKTMDDTKFVKDLAQGIWGSDNLKVRTVGKAVNGKVQATPAKVNVVRAALKGKLRARKASKQEIAMVGKAMNRWLGQKMYDCSRKDKKVKKEEPKDES